MNDNIDENDLKLREESEDKEFSNMIYSFILVICSIGFFVCYYIFN